MKKQKTSRMAHTASTQRGQGDFYGTGVRNKTATPKDITNVNIPKIKKLGQAPKALA